MPRVKRVVGDSIKDKFGTDQPYYSDEAQEKEMIALATAAAKKQMLDGTASAQVITHYLKLGTVREKLELEKLRKENELLAAKKTAIESAERIEALYAEAIKAMSIYNGQYQEDEVDIQDEYIDPDLY
jgi:hypothetical protein